jgi:hypothetical protein
LSTSASLTAASLVGPLLRLETRGPGAEAPLGVGWSPGCSVGRSAYAALSPLAGGDRPECGFGCVRGRARAGRIAAAAGRDRRDGEQGDEHHRANDHAGQYADQPPIVIQVWPNER